MAASATASDTPLSSSNRNERRRPRRHPAAGKVQRGTGTTTSSSDPANGVPVATGNPEPSTPSHNAALALRPSALAPHSATTGEKSDGTSQTRQQASNSSSRATPRSGRGRGSAPTGRHQTRVVENRAFGGQLTHDTGESEDGLGPPSTQERLHGGANEFTPGQSQHPTTKAQTRRPHASPQKRRLSKSQAPDIGTRVHEDIDNRQYECPICTSEVLRNSKIWSCHTCWTVFHIGCVKQWAKNSEAAAAEQVERNGLPLAPHQWRCPGCNLPQSVKPTSYTCWCGKEHDPRSITGLPPHSCGQTCGKQRVHPKKCPHPCELSCHAGPCPPCSYTGPKQTCFCGKEASTKKCLDTDYDAGWSCGKLCGDVLPCGEHTCQRPCHEGLCGGCEVRVDARCYCGKEQKAILCCDRDDDKPSLRKHLSGSEEEVVEHWTGMFQCTNTCERVYACGMHKCQKECHATEEMNTKCPRSPDLVTACPCGKTQLSQFLETPRSSCEDPIPHCEKFCLKPLACGHPCQQSCHLGECLPCLETVTIFCRCKRTPTSSICHQGLEEPPQCMRVCHTSLNCGRHECGERCCPGERKAIERHAAKKKNRPLGSVIPRSLNDDFEAEHICTRMCGRLLRCGNHTCQELCHKGPCGSCREAIFDEVSCNCGRTVLQPPLPCGTTAPPCRYQCERPRACGHPQVQHNCHTDNESCPKCPFLVTKSCLCGKKALKHQQCWFTDVRCGQPCGQPLKCGLHTCRKTCHRPGDCEDQGEGRRCGQACGRPKKACGHPCEDQCHAPYPCKQDKPCGCKIFITCPCQTKKQEVRCAASATAPGNVDQQLKCDDECARLERNRKLALALDIDPTTHTDEHVPYSADTLNMFAQNTKWAQDQEREFRVFAASEGEKRLRFKPMPDVQRKFLHALAEDFGLDSESLDLEPHRHVAVFKTPRFVAAPSKTLRDCLRIRQTQRATAAATAAEQLPAKSNAPSTNRPREPWNGLLLSTPRFALTIDEVQSALATAWSGSAPLAFNIQFLPSDAVALHAQPGPHTERTVSSLLAEAKPALARTFTAQNVGRLTLARFDASLNVIQAETDAADTDGPGGWSTVAAKAAAPRRTVAAPVAAVERGGFAVLSSGAAARRRDAEREKERRKAVKENVVDDWEQAEDALEGGGGDGVPLEGAAEVKGAADGVVAGDEVAEADAVGSAQDAGELDH